MHDTTEHPRHPESFYGRRKGRCLGISKQNALLLSETCTLERWKNQWPNTLWLEIGFGFGEHTHQWLQSHGGSLIGAEVFENGIAHLMHQLTPEERQRFALWPRPIDTLWEHLKPGILDGIIILFPDPWPKRRHHKRRLIQHNFLCMLERFLKPSGWLYFASDHQDLSMHVQETLANHPSFLWHSGSLGRVGSSGSEWPWPSTRYREKALQQGRECTFGIWQKTDIIRK